jgi:ATP-dependent Clp protease ATP-binding subunit ClpC
MATLNLQATQAYLRAAALAANYGNMFIDTHHLLFALLRGDDQLIMNVLLGLNVDINNFVLSLNQMAITEGEGPYGINLGITQDLQQVFVTALHERDTEDELIAPQHLLLAFIRHRDNYAANVLEAYGVNSYPIVAEKVREVLGKEGSITMIGASISKLDPDSTLAKIGGIDLTQRAREGKLDPVVGRESEIDRAVKILGRRTKKNPALIGDSGVGKTAIVEGLAQRIVDGDVPKHLLGKTIVLLDAASLISGAQMQGEFEKRLKAVIKELTLAKDIILFIDEMHQLMGMRSTGNVDASNILKPALARGEIQVIGATTLAEYRKYVEKDAALKRRFQPVYVGEPSAQETIEILEGLRRKYEAFHENVFITDEAVEAAVRLSTRYLTDRFQPDKAIDLMDEAAVTVLMRSQAIPSEGLELQKELRKIKHQLQVAAHNNDTGKYHALQERVKTATARIRAIRESFENTPKLVEKVLVTALDIADVVSDWTNIPVNRLAGDQAAAMLNMPELMGESIVGQEQAIIALWEALLRARTGLKDPNTPIGSFLFLGPTGVGKTEVARALARLLFGTEEAMVRIDMSEYMEKHTVSRLIGAPPGYVGYDQTGALSEPVRRRPYSVVLLDEIDKAHPDVLNLLLQVMSAGRLTDAQGNVVDFRNVILIMTSNAGVKLEGNRIGFRTEDDSDEVLIKAQEGFANDVLHEVKKFFLAEFLNRFDDIIVFHQLTRSQVLRIVDFRIAAVNAQLAEQGMSLSLDKEAKKLLRRQVWCTSAWSRGDETCLHTAGKTHRFW